ncbi:MAG: hypothetical protein C0180_04900 [Aciduliprofundum sp.]|nr:MAG: hypothetical protein C0180_04900 [Aciduliprofundum sp.]
MKIKELINKTMLKKEKGSILLDLALFLLLLVIFIVILAYFGITLNTLIAYIKKFFGMGVVYV